MNYTRRQRRRLKRKHDYTDAMLALAESVNSALAEAPSDWPEEQRQHWAGVYRNELRAGTPDADARVAATRAVATYQRGLAILRGEEVTD